MGVADGDWCSGGINGYAQKFEFGEKNRIVKSSMKEYGRASILPVTT